MPNVTYKCKIEDRTVQNNGLSRFCIDYVRSPVRDIAMRANVKISIENNRRFVMNERVHKKKKTTQ